jgi:hypothetical protein
LEISREIYWNIGHGVVIPMYFCALVALSLCLWGFYRRLTVYLKGRPLNRFDQLPKRVSLMIGTVLKHSQVLRVPGPGILHALFFWGFAQGLNVPRYPTLPNIMKARKKEIITIPVSDLLMEQELTSTSSIYYPTKRVGCTVLEGEVNDMADRLITILREKTSVLS